MCYTKNMFFAQDGLTTEYALEYRRYNGIKNRCYNKNCPQYKDYGGRGIKICDRWLGPNGFRNFLDDMGACPNKKLSIDRIDNDGDYSPENCRWATTKQQANNRRSNRYLTFNGETLTVAEWADKIGVKRHTLEERLRRGEPIESALTRKTKVNTGEIARLAREHNIKYLVLYKRLQRGWSLEDALTVPLQKSKYWKF